jgi:hypothetical protein
MSFIQDSTDYSDAKADVKLVRDAVEGQAAIKRETTTYLPHPNMLDKTSTTQANRYKSYIGRAEFDSSCGQTKTELMGAFTRADHEIDLPVQVKYLEDDSDGDWLSLSDSINVTFGNCLEVKFHILLAEFEDGGVDPDKQLSKAEQKTLKQRAKIVHYPREALTNWNYKVINGRMQLCNACLTTENTELNENFVKITVKTQLLLGLDENGQYRQMLMTSKQGLSTAEPSTVEIGDWIYPLAADKRLDYIPIEIVVDERTYAGKLPKSTGYLGPIANKDVARYQVNADLKEKLAILQDTIISTGWDEQSFDVFKTINGRDYVATGVGVSNQFPAGVAVDILKLTADGDAHFKYIEQNEKQTRALGGRYDTEPDAQKQTATEAEINSAKENAVLTMIAKNSEGAYRRLVAYCMQFEGVIVDPNEIGITINKQFSSGKISPEEAHSIIEQRDAGVMSTKSAVKQLKAGGYGDSELTVEEEVDLIDQDTPEPLVIPKVPGGQNNVEVQQ